MTMIADEKLKRIIKVENNRDYKRIQALLLPRESGDPITTAEKKRVERAVATFKRALEKPNV